MSKSFYKRNNDPSSNKFKNSMKNTKHNRSSMIERSLDKSTGDLSMRSKSSAMPDRNINSRKQSNDQISKYRKSTVNRSSVNKNNLSKRQSNPLKTTKSNNTNELTSESHTTTTVRK